MKIKFVHYKDKIKLTKYDNLYVVVCFFNGDSNPSWGYADFWDLPYSSESFKEALSMRDMIRNVAKKFNWSNKRIQVAKISAH